MKRMNLVALGLLLAGGVSCKSKTPGTDEHGHHHEAPSLPSETEEKGGAGHGVIVEQSMLRDLRVTTQTVESRPVSDTVTVLGEVRVREEAYAEIGTHLFARVSRVFVVPGDVVVAGQKLAELDSAEVGKARADLRTATARRELARQTLERRRVLADEQIVPRRDLQATLAEHEQTQAEQLAAQQSLAAMGASRGIGSKFILTSPMAGTILDRNAFRGGMASTEKPLFVVGDLKRLCLVVHAFERDALRILPGALARLNFPALPGQPFMGKVSRIGSRVDPTSRTIDVRIDLENSQGQLRPGMSATASIPLGDAAQTAVTVPVEAIVRQPQGWCVFIPTKEEGHFELRPVGRGRELGGEIEVLTGLKPGEQVVVQGAFLLKVEADKARGGAADEHHH